MVARKVNQHRTCYFKIGEELEFVEIENLTEQLLLVKLKYNSQLKRLLIIEPKENVSVNLNNKKENLDMKNSQKFSHSARADPIKFE